MSAAPYHKSVFLNCPFDAHYKPIFEAIVFTVYYARLVPRCALEVDDGTEFRLDKIFRIVRECRLGIHDISRTEPDAVNQLPRFNMPLELGVFLGCKKFGGPSQAKKGCLILDREPYRYQKFMSDISGQDIHAHHNNPKTAIAEVRAWLRAASGRSDIPGGDEIWGRYLMFQQELPEICRGMRIEPGELTFVDFALALRVWSRGNR